MAGGAPSFRQRAGGLVIAGGVHQIAAGAVPLDAITRHLLASREVIRGMGLRSEILVEADHIDGSLAGEVLPHQRWDEIAQPGDTAILHYSIASPAFAWVLERTDRIAMHYHNITPAELLWRYAPAIARECAVGRRQLVDLVPRVRHAAADSTFNALELAALGSPGASVVGVLRRPRPPARRLRPEGGRTRLLFVGRGVPNKAQHDLILALAALRQTDLDAELVLIGSWGGAESYERHCRRLAARLGLEDRLTLAGTVDDAALSQAYADADVFVCLSDHEGYCVPLVEAMEADLPIVAYAAGAIPETAGAAALLLDEKPPSLVAEAIVETVANPALRRRMAEGRRERLAVLSQEATAARLRAFVETL